jgi:SAM-dependent methyltransferase
MEGTTMESVEGRKTETEHWDRVHGAQSIRMRLPSALRTDTRNFMRLLRRYVKPGDRVVELGFAPGKNLAWVAARLGAEVTGLDYSRAGIGRARELFDALGLPGSFHCEDMFANSLPAGAFDVVYSHGVIEHFDDPRPAVSEHLRLLRAGGVAVIAIPNYRSVYGSLQRRFDPDNIAIHNLEMMTLPTLESLVPRDFRGSVRAFRFGRVVHSLVSWEKGVGPAAKLLSAGIELLGLLQPADIGPLCPWLVLEVRRLES